MLFDLLAKRANEQPNNVAVMGERSSLTYAALFREAGQFAGYLETLGLKSGDALLVGMPPSPDFSVAFYGACALGLLLLPNPPAGPLAPVY